MQIRMMPEEGDAIAFFLKGDFNSEDAVKLKMQVLQVMEQTGYKHLILDMEEVSFLESASLSVLTHAVREATKMGKKLSLRHPSAKVVSLLQITGLNRMFAVSKPAQG